MRTIFDKTTLNGMALNNRIVRSATWEGMCDEEGRPTDRLVALYGKLARGGIGLIITGFTYVRPDGKQLPGMMGIPREDFPGEMRALVRAVRGRGSRICMQLGHAGGQTDTRNAGRRPLAPSAIQARLYNELPEEMTTRDIDEIILRFAEGARRAKTWGFDAVQLHAAHGYLGNQFLSPLTNRRTDEYGGSIKNRSRFLMAVYRSVRAAVGSDYPVLIKLNGNDFLSGGLSVADAAFVAGRLSMEGIDAIEVSGGTSASGKESQARTEIDRPDLEAYHLPIAREIRQAVTCPLMVVGGFRSYEVAESAIREGIADYIAISRPFIREPDLPLRWRRGDRSRARCLSCNRCFLPGIKEGGIYCVAERKSVNA